MNATSFEKGIEKGWRESLQEMPAERFGPLAPAVLARMEQLSLERMRSLLMAVLTAKSLGELGLED